MKNNNIVKINSAYRYYDVSWTHKWDYNSKDPATVKLNIFKNEQNGGWWWFDSDSNDTKKISNIYFKYDTNNITSETKYLGPSDINGISHINFTNTIERIIIDRTPPVFISDVGTQYIIFNENRHFSFIFNDNNGVDPNNIQVFVGNTQVIKIDHISKIVEYKNGFSNLSLSKSENDYKLEFDLSENKIWNDESLNKDKLKVIVFDYASNSTEFVVEKTFKTYSNEDILGLEKLKIEFDTKKIILNKNNTNKIINVKITNPNKDLIDIPIFPYLRTGDNYVGIIDSKFTKQENGIMNLIIEVNYPGTVYLEAWLDISGEADILTSNQLKEQTINYETCGIILVNADQRLIHFGPNRPNNVKNEPFGAFIMFTEEFLNSMYTSLSDKTNIGILEKISRINDFNDIQKLEKDYMSHFAKQYSFEPNVNLQSLDSITKTNQIAISNSDIKNKHNDVKLSRMSSLNTQTNSFVDKSQKYSDFMDEKVESLLKAAFNQIPYFNSKKGTVQGLYMVLRLFGLNCKLLNLYIKNDTPDISINTKYYTKNDVENVNDYKLTSEFDLSIFENNLTVDEFNKQFDYYYKLVSSVLPVNKTLRKIKQVVTFNAYYNNMFKLEITSENIPTLEEFNLEFEFSQNMKDFINLNSAKNKFCNLIEIPFKINDKFYKNVLIKYFSYCKNNQIKISENVFENLSVEKILDNFIILKSEDDNFYNLNVDDIINISFKDIIHNV